MNESMHRDTSPVLPLLPLKNVVVLPKSIIPVIVGRPSSVEAVEYAFKEQRQLFITAQRDSSVDNPSPQDLFEYGTRSMILQIMRMPKGALKILIEGVCRSQAHSIDEFQGFLTAQCSDVPTTSLVLDVEVEALWRQLHNLYTHYSSLETKAPRELMNTVRSVEDIDAVADTLLAHINLSFADRQRFLETVDLKKRLLELVTIFKKEIAILETEERIRGQVQHQVEKNQREYYLTEQIKAIHKELGRGDDRMAEIHELQEKLKSLDLPKTPLERAQKEIHRLEQMPPMAPEATSTRNYIDWIMGLPWHQTTKDSISIEAAEEILNKHHAGLSKVKERIVEFLAAKKFSTQLTRSPIICLVGPPGVGKTSLAESIAQSLEREFVRISLGGVKDEAEIRGHRRTYIGSLPGKIIQAMRKAKTINPVILFDEIDKMSTDSHGDPASALLEVLDPEQNKNFVDHFLEIEYDLSQVLFITTANHLEGIPYPLFDRMEIIQVSGYTEHEKVAIAQQFLIPKNRVQYGLEEEQCTISQEIIRLLINNYTKEAGVRQLERLIAKLMRKTIQLLLKESTTAAIAVTPEHLLSWLGAAKCKPATLDSSQEKIGLATGLAWTELGGDMLEIEATVIPGKGNVTLTGQLGEVMQESAHAALTYIKSRALPLGLTPNFNANKDIHIHIPEGATPKDGPSAGITLCTALVSALTKNPTKPKMAMTGEITLRGRVLPIGGLKEKILAAQQQGMETIILPHENKEELEEIKTEVDTKNITFICAQAMDDVLKTTLTRDPFKIRKKRKVKKKSKKST